MEWEMLIKRFYFINGGHFVEGMGAILAISVEGHPRNIFVKLFWKQTIGLCRLKFFYF